MMFSYAMRIGGAAFLTGLLLTGIAPAPVAQAEDAANADPANANPAQLDPPLLRSAASGPWSAAATWEGGQLPQAGARVQIRTGHEVVTT